MLLLPLVAFALTAPLDLRVHAWRHRVVLVFSPDAAHPALAAQRLEWGGREPAVLLGGPDAGEFDDRDLVVYLVTPTLITREGAGLREVLPPDPSLRARLGVSLDTFTVLLLGKDTGEKAREVGATLTREALFSRIDSMPMRQAEMRRGGE